MNNLLLETLKTLKANFRSESDILWCSTSIGWFSWKEFVELADINFNKIGALINPDLQIVGKDFIMYWTNNDNDQEWWFTSILPDKPETYHKPKSLLI